MEVLVATPLDPSGIVSGIGDAVNTAVTSNLGTIGVYAGGLVALGVVLRLLGRLVGRRA